MSTESSLGLSMHREPFGRILFLKIGPYCLVPAPPASGTLQGISSRKSSSVSKVRSVGPHGRNSDERKAGDMASSGRHSAPLAAKGSSPGLLGEELGPASRRPGSGSWQRRREERELAGGEGGESGAGSAW